VKKKRIIKKWHFQHGFKKPTKTKVLKDKYHKQNG